MSTFKFSLLGLLLLLSIKVTATPARQIDLLVAPNHCPRCESAIPGLFEYCRDLQPSCYIRLTLVVRSKREADMFIAGLQGHSYRGMDTMLIDSSAGRLDMMDEYDDVPVLQIRDGNGRLLLQTETVALHIDHNPDNPLFQAMTKATPPPTVLRRLSRTEIQDSARPIFAPMAQSLGRMGDSLVYVLDLARLRVQAINYETGTLASRFEPSFALRRSLCPGLTDAEFSQKETAGTARTMCFNPTPSYTGDTIFIHSSIPNITIDTASGKVHTSINAENPLLVFSKDGASLGVDTLGKPPGHSVFTLLTTAFNPYTEQYFVPLEKIKPEHNDANLDPVMDPSDDRFYHPAHLFTVYDKGFHRLGVFGQIDPLYQKLRIGFNNCLVGFAFDTASSFIFQTLSSTVLEYPSGQTLHLSPPCENSAIDSLEKPNGYRWTNPEITGLIKKLGCGIWSTKVVPHHKLIVVWHESRGENTQTWQPLVQTYSIVKHGRTDELVLDHEALVPVGKDEMVLGALATDDGSKLVILKQVKRNNWIETYELD